MYFSKYGTSDVSVSLNNETTVSEKCEFERESMMSTFYEEIGLYHKIQETLFKLLNMQLNKYLAHNDTIEYAIKNDNNHFKFDSNNENWIATSVNDNRDTNEIDEKEQKLANDSEIDEMSSTLKEFVNLRGLHNCRYLKYGFCFFFFVFYSYILALILAHHCKKKRTFCFLLLFN